MASFDPSALDWLCFALLIAGAINWLVVGLVDINVVSTILEPIFQPDAAEAVERVIYVFVGLAGIYFFYPLYRISQARSERTVT